MTRRRPVKPALPWEALCPKSDHRARVVLLCAHPDDETIGAAATIMRAQDIYVTFLTDGAPVRRELWTSRHRSREDYLRTRLREALSALKIGGVEQERVLWMGATDQEAIYYASPLAKYFCALLQHLSPHVVITHPYEGGHPDHDAAALIARLAISMLARKGAPCLLEMTSYHARQNTFESGEFLQSSSHEEIAIPLAPDEVERKGKMLEAYRSQKAVLHLLLPGLAGPEKLRPAPAYRFTDPPHPGELWYERLAWEMTGARWRVLARSAIASVEICSNSGLSDSVQVDEGYQNPTSP